MSKDKKLKFILNTNTQSAVVEEEAVPIPLQISDKPIPGLYKVVEHQQLFGSSWTFDKFEVALPNTAEKTSELIMDIKEIERLFSPASLRIHAAMGNAAKMGFLLYGPQGTGKSTAMYSVAQQLIAKFNATVLEIQDHNDLAAAYYHIKQLRKLEPNTMAVVLMDECEGSMKHYESKMKLLLDSKETPSNFIFIGATNYIEAIPATIKNRPSRIKHLFDCKDINKDEIIVYTILRDMNKELEPGDQLSDEAIKIMVPKAVSKTIDEIKHLFLGAAITRAETQPKPKTKKKTGVPACEELT